MTKDNIFVQCLLARGNLLTSAWIEPKYIKSNVSLRTKWTGRSWRWTKGWKVVTAGKHYLMEEEVVMRNMAYRTMLPIVFNNNKHISFGKKDDEKV